MQSGTGQPADRRFTGFVLPHVIAEPSPFPEVVSSARRGCYRPAAAIILPDLGVAPSPFPVIVRPPATEPRRSAAPGTRRRS